MRRAAVGRGRAEPARVSWRDGVHIADTPIWCDARRSRDVCFASRYEAVPPARHGQRIASAATLALYGVGAGAVLAPPWGRPFTLGTARLELIRSGAGLGAASLAVEVAGVRVVYAGAVGAGEGIGGAADLRPCDVLVLASEVGDVAGRVPLAVAIAGIAERWRGAAAAGGALVVAVAGALDGVELAAALGPLAGRALSAQHGLRAAIERARTVHPGLPPVRRASSALAAGDLALWPARRLAALGGAPASTRRVLVCGAAADPALRAHLPDGIPWTLEADGPTALAYIRATGARTVYLTGRAGPSLAAQLADLSARPLGPPQQMALF